MEVSSSVAWRSTGRFDVDGMLPLPLTRFGVQLGVQLFVILVNVMNSSNLFFFSFVILSISLIPDYMVLHQKGA